MREYGDFLPLAGMLPPLSQAEVDKFIAMGEFGQDQFKLNRLDLAEPAFRKQIGIFPGNYEPFVSLAFLEAGRGKQKAAVDHLRSAVLRGFTDLDRVLRAEGWPVKSRTPAILELIDAIPRLEEIERDWPRWDAFHTSRPLASLALIEEQADAGDRRIDALAPALGPRLTRLWKRVATRSSAAQLEAYVTAHGDAADLEPALERLMTLYAGGALQRWERRSDEVARRLGATAQLMLERFPENPRIPEAHVASALAAFARRTPEGDLPAESLESIRRSLGRVLDDHRDSAVLPAAIVGLVRSELKAGNPDRAAASYKAFKRDHAADVELRSRVQSALGTTGLRLAGLPDFQARSLDGATVTPAGLAGKVVVIDFWATWCGPCVEEFPTLKKIEAKFGDDVAFVGVNLDRPEMIPPETLREWIAEQGLPGSQISDGAGWDSSLIRAFGVTEIPFNVVVDAQGTVVALNEHGKKLERAVRGAIRNDADRTPVGSGAER